MSIASMRLKNFTVFDDFRLKFSPNINIFIGKNGTGKTHILKAIYAICELSVSYGTMRYNYDGAAFNKCFNLNVGNIHLLHDKKNPLAEIWLNLSEESGHATFRIVNNSSATDLSDMYDIHFPQIDLSAVFIPAKDMLTHSKGLLEMSQKYRNFPFDKTLTDIVQRTKQWSVKTPPQLAVKILPTLENMMAGQVVFSNDDFYIKKRDGRMIHFEAEAEGLKKVGLLWQLLMTENITEKSILLWDEPEANLNPEYLPKIVECLLNLSKSGVQIFLSTHNYVFAKYFDVLRDDSDAVLFHSLYFRKNFNGVRCETQQYFAEIKHNDISDAFNVLLDRVYDIQVKN